MQIAQRMHFASIWERIAALSDARAALLTVRAHGAHFAAIYSAAGAGAARGGRQR